MNLECRSIRPAIDETAPLLSVTPAWRGRRLCSRTGRDWCPSQSAYLEQRFPTLLNLFESLEPLRPPADHGACYEQRQCLADSSVPDQPKHICAGERCGEVQVTERDLLPILRNGDVPILYFDTDTTAPEALDVERTAGARNVLKVRARRSDDVYVAISHVWADGLGNRKANALPQCQVAQLWRNVVAVLAAQEAMHLRQMCFWLDTFCIPVNPLHKDLKEQQIAKMTSIYAQAYITLVLDSGLMSIRGKSAVWGDPLIAQILTCRWATRSWCYQEGCLSERCAFRLAEKILLIDRQTFHEKRSDAWRVAGISKDINISWILPRVPQQFDNSHDSRRFWRVSTEAKAYPEHDELFAAFAGSGGLLSRYCNISDNEQAGSHIQAEFANVWNALAGRYTTMIEDVDLIFATVLDFDIQPLLTLALNVRMRHICLSLPTLPLSILFRNVNRSSTSQSSPGWWIPTGVNHELLEAGGHHFETSRNYSSRINLVDHRGYSGALPRQATLEISSRDYYVFQVLKSDCRNSCHVRFKTRFGLRTYRIEGLRLSTCLEPPDGYKKCFIVFERGPFRARQDRKCLNAVYLHGAPVLAGSSRLASSSRPTAYHSAPFTLVQVPSHVDQQCIATHDMFLEDAFKDGLSLDLVDILLPEEQSSGTILIVRERPVRPARFDEERQWRYALIILVTFPNTLVLSGVLTYLIHPYHDEAPLFVFIFFLVALPLLFIMLDKMTSYQYNKRLHMYRRRFG